MSRFSFRKTTPVEPAPVGGAPAAAPAPQPAATHPAPGSDASPPAAAIGARMIIEEPPPPRAPADNSMLDLRLKLHARLIDEIDLSKLDKLEESEMRRQVRKLVGDFAREERLALNTSELDRMGAEVFDEMVGLGPIEPLL